MTDDDLARAAEDRDAELAALQAAGVGPGDLEPLIEAEPDPATDGLECDHGAALAAEIDGDADG